MELNVNTVIDSEKCIGCGLCVKVCPYETLSLVDGKAKVTGETSLNCGHCTAVCPAEAIAVKTLAPLTMQTFTLDNAWLKPGSGDTAHLVQLMASRRSCRNFTTKPVDKNILEDLVNVGTTAPSGSNSQEWTFTILPDRAHMEAFGKHIITFFQKLNRLARNKALRTCLRLVGQNALQHYHERYAERMEERIRQWEIYHEDVLFHGAQALILVGGAAAASCPQEDAMLATQNILLAAHTMGLGTCLIGFAVVALTREKKIGKALGLAKDEHIFAAIAIGWPNEKYEKIILRKKIIPRYPNRHDLAGV